MLAETLESLVMRHGVVSVILTVTELEPASVDRQAVVQLSPSMQGVSALSVDRHGVLVFMVVCSVNKEEVRFLLLTSPELTATCVDGQGVVPLSLQVENDSVPCVDEHGVLAFTVLCCVNVCDVVLLSMISAELTVTCADE